jgi:L-ascorbate metabolism protein UlaG (beta-lactamase superfamily)
MAKRAPADAVTWWGHSTTMIEVGGERLLTDPLLRDRVSALRWAGEPPPARLAESVSAVLVSHLHSDHLDLPSLAMFAPGTPILVPQGAGNLVRPRVRGEVREVRVGDQVKVGSVTVHVVHAEHDGRRWPVGRPVPALGYLVCGGTRGGAIVFFAGDTDLHPSMADLRDVDIGLALLPVWGWGPALGTGHLDPRRAAEALLLLEPAKAVPIHWGGLRVPVLWRVRPTRITEPGAEFARAAARIAPAVEVVVPAPGTRVAVPGPRG